MKNLPLNINWFIENLKDSEIFKNAPFDQVFKYSTEELTKNLQDSQKLTSLLLLERFFWENIEENFFSYKLLSPILEKKDVSGYLFYFPEKGFFRKKQKFFSEFTFIKIDENYYFYPLEWGNIFKIFLTLWKNKTKFFSVEINLSKEISIELIKEHVELAKILDFTCLSKKTLETLKEYLPTLSIKALSEITHKFLKTPDSTLILSSKDGIKDNLKENGAKIIKAISNEKNNLFLVKDLNLDRFISLCKKFFEEIKVGILPKKIWERFKKKGLSPMMFLIGAFEHAKRVNHIKIKVFEGFTYHVIGDLYYEWKDFGKALKYYLIAKDYTMQPVELILSESAIYYTFGEIDKAEKTLREGLCSCKKEDPLIHYNLALIYLKKEENEKAKYHLYKAHLLDPGNKIFSETLAKCLWDYGEYEELEEFLSSLKNLSVKEKIYLGKLHFLKKDYRKAFEYLKEILTFKERDGETLIFLAWLYLYFNKEKEISQVLLREAKEILSAEEIEKIKRNFGLVIE